MTFSRFRSKIRVRVNRHDYSFKDRAIGFQQNMQIEHGYQKDISDFKIIEKLKNGEDYQHFSQNFP